MLTDIILQILLLHVCVHGREVLLEDVVGGSVGDGAEAEGGLAGQRIAQALVFQTAQVGILLSAS